MSARPGWYDDAACAEAGVAVDVFFPSSWESADRAILICQRCPVRVDCLNAALAVPDWADHGVWGGTSKRERERIRQRRRRGRVAS